MVARDDLERINLFTEDLIEERECGLVKEWLKELSEERNLTVYHELIDRICKTQCPPYDRTEPKSRKQWTENLANLFAGIEVRYRDYFQVVNIHEIKSETVKYPAKHSGITGYNGLVEEKSLVFSLGSLKDDDRIDSPYSNGIDLIIPEYEKTLRLTRSEVVSIANNPDMGLRFDKVWFAVNSIDEELDQLDEENGEMCL